MFTVEITYYDVCIYFHLFVYILRSTDSCLFTFMKSYLFIYIFAVCLQLNLVVYNFSCLSTISAVFFTTSAVYLQIHLFVYNMSCLFTSLTVCLHVHLHFHLFVYISIYMCTFSAVYLHFHLFVYNLSCLFTILTVCLHFHLFIYFQCIFTFFSYLFMYCKISIF